MLCCVQPDQEALRFMLELEHEEARMLNIPGDLLNFSLGEVSLGHLEDE